ncbi:hypothetical protein R1sor_010336 [Riccia sorocarpa]|uniref:BED-type domain-containing protein n=1 Tax=Riccia sorocarpa TaxID=122646 RepID=A0ABD3I1M2_9MARC
MKTENVEAGPSALDAGIPQPHDEAGKFTIRHYVVLPNQKPGNPRIRCRYCTFEITHNITRMKHHLIGLKAAPPKASTALNKRGEKNQHTCQFVPVVVREELTRLMSVQECKSGVEGEHYKACKVEPDEGDLRSSQAASPSPGFSSNPDLAQGSMEYNRALRDRSASRTPASSLLVGPESACGLSFLEPERKMPSKNDIRYYHNMKQQHEADKKWARAVYELGLPFNIFTHKVFKEVYEFSKHLPGYALPGLKKLSNDLLEDEFKEVKDRTEKLMFPPQGFSKKIRRFVDEHEEPTKFGCDLSKWLDDQAEDNEVRGRTEAPAFAGETSEPRTDQSQERQRPKKFEDDNDDDDLCSEEGDAESEDDCLIDVLLREQVRFDNGSASVKPGHNERLVTVQEIAYDETISISLPKVEVEQAVSKPEYGRLIDKMWEKFAAPAPAKQPVVRLQPECSSCYLFKPQA